MSRRAPRLSHHISRAIVSIAAALVLVASGSGLSSPTRAIVPSRAQSKPPDSPPPGQLVDIGGQALHLRCVGPTDARPIVMLEAGGGAFSSAWTQVQEALAPRVRSCAYDRAGSGWSPPGPTPRTMRQQTFELHALVKAAKLRGPFVLVGQSIGGLLVRRYAREHGRDVAGMVLVDPTHENGRLYNTRLARWVRLPELASDRRVPAPRRAGERERDSDGKPDEDFMAEEFQQIARERQERPNLLGDRPLIVLAAGRRPPPPGMSEADWTPLREERETLLRELTTLSRHAKFVRDPASGHNMQADNPALVAGAIEEVVRAAAARTRLTP